MQVTVSFLGPLRDQIGKPSMVVELPAGSTYADLLESIAPTMESKLADWAWDAANHTFSRRVMVSRSLLADLRDETTNLADGDEIVVLMPLAGG